MPDWNPDLYSKFESQRTRPARELLSAVNLTDAALVYDLGCGPGNSTELLVQRFARSRVIGIDSSPAMVLKARQRVPQASFELKDVSTFSADEPADLVFANATLQWLPNHHQLVPQLITCVRMGGYLAVQMPNNFDEPTHRLMREVIARPEFQGAQPTIERAHILKPAAYYDLLSTQCIDIDIGQTTYEHVMDSAEAIVGWMTATGLRPYLDALSPDRQLDFLAAYQEVIAKQYRPMADGKRLMSFPRLFICARRRV